MLQLERHSLVWPTPAGWAALQTQAQTPADSTAQAIVSHWHAERLPLVVSRQPAGLAAGQVALGLPAPLQWARRRLAFTLPTACLAYSGCFPRLGEVAARQRWRTQALALEHTLGAVQVYGSYGWQWLTGLRYLRDSSDLDLRIPTATPAQARAAVQALAAQPLPCRIDGELVFPSGDAVAWREYAQLLDGSTHKVLCKRLHSVALRGWDTLHPPEALAA